MAKTIAAIALGAGLSLRMGKNKLLLPWQGKPLGEHVLHTLARSPMEKKVLVSNAPLLQERGAALGFLVGENQEAQLGISTSIRRGLTLAGKGWDGYLFVTCDQPLLRLETVQALCEAFCREDKIIVPQWEGQRKNPCIFPGRYYDELAALTGDQGGKVVYRAHPEDVLLLSVGSQEEYQDIDTPQSFAWLEQQRKEET